MKVRWKMGPKQKEKSKGSIPFRETIAFFPKHGVPGGGGGVSWGQDGMEWDCICSWVLVFHFLVSPHDDSKVVCVSGSGGGRGISYRIFTPS